MNEIKCPQDLNQFLSGEPIFENTFPEKECEQRKFYGDCYHCFATSIASRDKKLKTLLDTTKQEPTTLSPAQPGEKVIRCKDCKYVWKEDGE